MIFVTLGSQKFQFNRLLMEIDKIVSEKKINEKIFAQIGYSDYLPVNYEYKKFLDREEFGKKMDEADVVITHGGTGAIINAVKRGKKVIAVPRMAKYGEHVDDHQLQIVDQFENLNFICGCKDIKKLNRALTIVNETSYATYVSTTGQMINSIKKFIEE